MSFKQVINPQIKNSEVNKVSEPKYGLLSGLILDIALIIISYCNRKRLSSQRHEEPEVFTSPYSSCLRGE
jgi:hypothetical protein